ncbi:MAG: thioesterase [Bacteroidales bacterium]|nr:thioesterase [Bacteroidales bacterium]
MKTYSEDYYVKSYETDINANLKLFAFMNYAQELAGRHADLLGFGYDNLIGDKVAWVLSRFHVKFDRTPKWRENLTLKTWHKGGDRLFWYRDFEATDKSGEVIIKATSSWVVINIETRKMHRIDSLGHSDSINIQDSLPEHAEKIASPHEMEHIYTKKVSFSDIDINRHTNNAKYVEWAMDAIDPEFASEMSVTDMFLNFNMESRLGDSIEIFRSVTGNTVVVEGKKEGSSVFSFKLLLA